MSQGKAVLFALAAAHGWLVESLFLGPAAWDLRIDCRVNTDAFGPRRALAAGGRRWGMLSPPAASLGQAGLWLSIAWLAGEVTPEPCPHHAGAKAGREQDG